MPESVGELLTQICSGLTNNRWVLRNQNRGYAVEAWIVRFFLEIRMICVKHLRVFVNRKKSLNVREAEIANAIQVTANRPALDGPAFGSGADEPRCLLGILIARVTLRMVHTQD